MRTLLLGVLVALAMTPALAEEKRQLGAHEHGHGKLDIAVEGNKVRMALEAPGADIVGFEHAAKSEKDKKAIAAAKKILMDPLSLFVPAPAAGCKLTSAMVELGEENEHYEHHDNTKKAPDVEHQHEAHNAFQATYELTCAKPGDLTTMTFKYFDAFPGGRELDIQLIAPKGQSKYEATRKSPTITLQSMR
jgi:hypothetical protein